jgi:Domain of unknown function (DUF6378)
MKRAKKIVVAAADPLVVNHDTHGDFDECARVSQEVLRTMRSAPRWKDLTDAQVEAIQMIAHKLHRIVCGDPNHLDHWVDIAGYARLAQRSVEKAKK